MNNFVAGIMFPCLLSPVFTWAQADQPPLPTLSAAPHEMPLPNEAWQPGVDYILLVPPNKTQVSPGKVELVVRFLYTGSVYREMERYLQSWKKPDYLEVVHQPAIKWPHARLFAQMFYTLEQFGRAQELHLKLYDWIWQQDHYPIYHTVADPDVVDIHRLNFGFAQANSIDLKSFKAVYFSKEIHNKVVMDAAQAYNTGALFVVNGRYGTDYARAIRGEMKQYGTPENYARLLQIIEYLAASEYQRMTAFSATRRPVVSLSSPELRSAEKHANSGFSENNPSQTVYRRPKPGKIFAVRHRSGRDLYPTFPFGSDSHSLPISTEALTSLERDPKDVKRAAEQFEFEGRGSMTYRAINLQRKN